MANCYYVFTTIEGHNPNKAQEIYAAIRKEWSVDHAFDEFMPNDTGTIMVEGCDAAPEREGGVEIAARIRNAVWDVNNGCCSVITQITALHSPTHTVYAAQNTTRGPLKPIWPL